MFEISDDFSWQVRKKRAFTRKTRNDVASEIGVSRTTLRKVENGKVKRVSRPVFLKIVNWLMKDYE